MKSPAITLIVLQSGIAPVLRREIPDPPFSWGPVLAEPVPASVPADH